MEPSAETVDLAHAITKILAGHDLETCVQALAGAMLTAAKLGGREHVRRALVVLTTLLPAAN